MTPPPPKQEKPKDPAREAAKNTVRAVFKEVGDREPTSEEAARIVTLCRELYYGGDNADDDAPCAPPQKKEPGRQGAKETMRAVFKEVGSREPTSEESARIVALCRQLYFGGGGTAAKPRAVGAQPIADGASSVPPSMKAPAPPSTPPASTPPNEAKKPKSARPEPPRQKAESRVVVPITQLKVTQPLRPEQLPRDVLPREGTANTVIEIVFAVSSAPGKPVLPIRAMFSARNYRRALNAIEEFGENATILLQGRLTGDGELVGAGISVQPNKVPSRKEVAKAEAPPRVQQAPPASESAVAPSASGQPGAALPLPEKKAPALPPLPFVVRPGERIGRWIVVRESSPRDGDRQIHCRCRTCGFGRDLAADELVAPVLPLCRRCE